MVQDSLYFLRTILCKIYESETEPNLELNRIQKIIWDPD